MNKTFPSDIESSHIKKRKNENHPWKNAFSWKTIKEQKEVNKEIKKRGIK